MEKLKLGFIGLGQRGEGWVVHHFPNRDDIEVVAMCDIDPKKIEKVEKGLEAKNMPIPKTTTDYREILADPEVEAVMIASAWESHAAIAIAAMKAGKPTAMEVGGAYSVDECFRLVHTQEETGTFFMMMENCCYGRRELMVLDMVNKGLFGEVVHCEGGYRHDLRNEISRGKELGHYRHRNYLIRNCDNYPTHQLLPICKILGVNDGNRMVSLVSVASCAKGLREYSEKTGYGKEDIVGHDVMQGDVITTIIKCAHGETITLTLDTTLPRCYSRDFGVHGTKAMYCENGDFFYFDDNPEHHKAEWSSKPLLRNADGYQGESDHPLWQDPANISGGHGGIDGLVFSAFVNCVQNGWESPIDVYDAASVMCISALSEESIATGHAVGIPDFTNGEWLKRVHGEDHKYTIRRKR